MSDYNPNLGPEHRHDGYHPETRLRSGRLQSGRWSSLRPLIESPAAQDPDRPAIAVPAPAQE